MGRYGAAFVAGAVFGGVTGAAVTLWRAPQPGGLTRAQFGEQLLAHAGPARGALVAAGSGLNAAGIRLVQGVTIATRFVEELIDPSATVPAAHRSSPVGTVPGGTASTGTAPVAGSPLTPVDLDARTTATSATSAPAVTWRPAAMTTTRLTGR